MHKAFLGVLKVIRLNSTQMLDYNLKGRLIASDDLFNLLQSLNFFANIKFRKLLGFFNFIKFGIILLSCMQFIRNL